MVDMNIYTHENPQTPRKLEKKVYLVGGAVRDEILKRPVKDRDWVVVGATPEEMLADGFKQVGADFPVFLHPESGEEYALARVERKTGDGYHGFTVRTEDVTVSQDLSRRDLTINSIAKDAVSGQYIDPFGGIADLEAKILRHTGAAFAEDPLRVIRLARFAARFPTFSIAQETQDLAVTMIRDGALDHIPYERFWAEIAKVLRDAGDPGRFFQLLFDWKVRENIQFFNDVFGSPRYDTPYLNFVSTAALNVSKIIPAEMQLATFVAIVGRADFLPIAGASVEMMKLHNVVQLLRKVGEKPTQREKIEAVYELMKAAKPWGEGKLFDHLLDAVDVISWFSLPVLSAYELLRLKKSLLQIRAEQFPNLQGKELGEAIEKARKINIELAL